MIYTFYSYKGGVGRSMALANVAELFYQTGLRVLMVDWDLEAPGLEQYFPVDKTATLGRRGVIDMILSYKTKMAQELKDDEPLKFEGPETLSMNIYPKGAESGELRLLTAGRRSKGNFNDYARAVLSFDWKDFYENWEGERYIEWFRQQAEAMADVVLIDSRTGVTEIGGVCTYHLADVVVMFCSANNQSIDGTLQMIENFSDEELLKLRHNRELKTLVVPARIEKFSEIIDLNKFRQKFATKFDFYIPEEIRENKDLFEELEIPYVPKYAFNDIIAVNQEKNSYQYSPELRQTYHKLTQLLAMFVPSGSIIREKLERLPVRKRIEKTETDKACEMHRHKVLHEIITKYLHSDEMKKISFFLLGPGEFDRLIGNTHGEKAVSLLEKLDFRDKINDLILYLQEFNLSELGEEYSEKLMGYTDSGCD